MGDASGKEARRRGYITTGMTGCQVAQETHSPSRLSTNTEPEVLSSRLQPLFSEYCTTLFFFFHWADFQPSVVEFSTEWPWVRSKTGLELPLARRCIPLAPSCVLKRKTQGVVGGFARGGGSFKLIFQTPLAPGWLRLPLYKGSVTRAPVPNPPQPRG